MTYPILQNISKAKSNRIILLGVLILVMSLFNINITLANTGVNAQIPYSGTIIKNDGTGLEGLYKAKFLLYNAPSGGTAIYEEIRDGSTSYAGTGVSPALTVSDGRFEILLGSQNTTNFTSILNDDSLWLELQLDMDNNGSYEEIFAPRKRLGSALSAINSMRLVANGGTSTNTLSLDSTGNLVFTGDGAIERMRITGTGNVGIGTNSPQTLLDVNGIANVATGYRVANAAASGQYLRGNGTNFVSSGIQAADVPTLNQNTTGNAATAGGLAVHNTQGTQNSANQIVRTQANGYTHLGWINTTSGDLGTTAPTRIYASNDGYIRYYTPANFLQVLNLPTRTGGSASGTWGINITGNAATVTNGVYTSGDQTIAGIKTFSGIPAFPGRINGGGAASHTYGSISIGGQKNTYAGIAFPDANAVFMVRASDALSGVHVNNTTWRWYFDGSGVLTVGTVPWARLSGVPSTLSGTVNTSGDQTIAGIKTFSNNIIFNANVGIGTASPGTRLHVNGGIRYTAATANTNTTVCRNSSGDLAGCSSLASIKDNVTDLPVGLNAVMQLRPVSFDWKSYTNEPSTVRRDLGFIAEEVAAINPLLARYNDVTGDLEGVRYSQLTSLLTRAIQEQQQLILEQRDKLSLYNTALSVRADGNVGIGTTSPTAKLHLAAGTATVNTSPLKFTAGTNLTTPEAGAVEWNGTNLFLTTSVNVRQTINQGLTATDTLDFPSTNNASFSDLTVTVTGAVDGDVVTLGIPNASVPDANSNFTAWVSANNTVTVRFNNNSGVTQDPASGSFKVFVTKF